MFKKIKGLVLDACQNAGVNSDLAGQQLCQVLQQSKTITQNEAAGRSVTNILELLLDPLTVQYQQPDNQLRQRLAQNPVVTLTTAANEQHDATLTRSIFDEACSLADSLYISEADAFSLYHYVLTTPDIKQLDSGRSGSNTNHNDATPTSSNQANLVCNTARHLYFYERSLLLRTTLMLFQCRHNSKNIAMSANTLLQAGLITKLIDFIPYATSMIDQMQEKAQQADNDIALATATNSSLSSSVSSESARGVRQQRSIIGEHLDFWCNARQTAAECLFFIAYSVQLTANEICSLLDLVQDLSNSPGLKLLNPFTDVPDPYKNLQAETIADQQAQNFFSPPSSWASRHRKEKAYLDWQHELVESVHKTGYPALFRCVGILIVTCIVALDTKTVFVDRNTHQPNLFGKVRTRPVEFMVYSIMV